MTAPLRSPTLTLLLIASTLTVMAGSTVAPVLEVIRGDLGVSGTAAGLIITAHGLAGATGVFTTTYPALIASRLGFGVGAAAVFSGTTVALLGLYRGAQRVLPRTRSPQMGGAQRQRRARRVSEALPVAAGARS